MSYCSADKMVSAPSAENQNQSSSEDEYDPFTSTTTTFGGASVVFSVLPATPESGNSETIQFSLRTPPGISAHPLSQRFYQILAESAALHAAKQADYGRGDDPFSNVRSSEEWGLPGWVGAMIRAQDKIRRLQSLLLKGKLENESAEDSLRDLAVYAIISLVLFEESQQSE